MYIDLNDSEDVERDDKKEVGAFEVPFNMYIQGSYFGDSDFYEKKTDKFLDTAPRCNSTEAQKECHLMQIKVKELKQLFDRFREIRKQMTETARVKRHYHETLIKELIRKKIQEQTEQQQQLLKQFYEATNSNNQFIGQQQPKEDGGMNLLKEISQMGAQRENKVEVINYSEGMKNIIKQTAETQIQRKKSEDDVLRQSVT